MKCLHIFSLLLSLATCVHFAQNTRLVVKKFHCTGQPYEISKLHFCQLQTFRNGSQVAGVILRLQKPLPKVYLSAGIYTQYFRTRTHLLSTEIEYCQFRKERATIQNAAASFALDYALQHFPQVLVECPVRNSTWFNITNIQIDDNLIPVFVLPGTYHTEVRIYSKRNQTIFQGWLETEVR